MLVILALATALTGERGAVAILAIYQACLWHYVINVWNVSIVSPTAGADKAAGDRTGSTPQ